MITSDQNSQSPPASTLPHHSRAWRQLDNDDEREYAKLCITCATNQCDSALAPWALAARKVCGEERTLFFVRELPFYEHHNLVEMRASQQDARYSSLRFLYARQASFHSAGTLGLMITGDPLILRELPLLSTISETPIAWEYARFYYDHVSTPEGSIRLIGGIDDFVPSHWAKSDAQERILASLAAQLAFPCANEELCLLDARQEFLRACQLDDRVFAPPPAPSSGNIHTGTLLSATVEHKATLFQVNFVVAPNGEITTADKERNLSTNPLPIVSLRSFHHIHARLRPDP